MKEPNKVKKKMISRVFETDYRRIIEKLGNQSNLKNQRILITGGLGLIGLYIVKYLIFLNNEYPEININVIILVRNLEKAKERLGEDFSSSSLKVVIHDIITPIPKLGPIDIIVHAASPANGVDYEKTPVFVIKANTLGTDNLLNYAVQNKTKTFIYVSTGDVTGEVNKSSILESDYGPLDNTKLRSCYAEGKRISEAMCVAWSVQYGIRTLIIRPDHTYGPTIDLEKDIRVFADFVKNIISGKNIILKSDGLAERTFCYLQDFLEGFLVILEKGEAANVYNISNPAAKVAIKELAKLLSFEYFGAENSIKFENRGNAFLENPIKQRPSLDISKMRSLGYSPEVDILEGFKRTIEAFMHFKNLGRDTTHSTH